MVNYIRVSFIDGSQKYNYCSSSDSHSSSKYDDHHRLLGEDTTTYSKFWLYNILVHRSLAGGGSSNYESIEESISKSCLNYIFVYVFVCVCILTAAIFIIYFLSSLYLDRLIKLCLAKDGIYMNRKVDQRRRRSAYLDSLQLMQQSERVVTDKTRKSILELHGLSVIEGADDIIFEQSPHDDEENFKGENPGRRRAQSSVRNRHLSFSLDEYHGIRQLGEQHDQHLRELIKQLPWYRRALFYMYRSWERFSRFIHRQFYREEHDHEGRRSSFSDPDSPRRLSFDEGMHDQEDEKAITHGEISKRRLHSKIFLFGSSGLYYRSVELGLLFQCFYISIWATQIMPLAQRADEMNGWIFAFTLPIIFNTLLVGLTLHRSVMLKTASELHSDIVGTVCEECIKETQVTGDLRTRVRNKLIDTATPRKMWKSYIRDQFLSFDVDENGSLDRLEFREFLGSLNIYIGRSHFDILWEAIDLDLSGKITWDELFVVVFPEFKSDIRDELKIIENVQNHFKIFFQNVKKIPKSKYLETLQEIFKKYDSKNLNKITKTELWHLLRDCGVSGLNKKSFLLLYGAIDLSAKGEISFEDFSRIVFGQDLFNILSSNNNVITMGGGSRATSRSSISKLRSSIGGLTSLGSNSHDPNDGDMKQNSSDVTSEDVVRVSNFDRKSDDSITYDLTGGRTIKPRSSSPVPGRGKRSVVEMVHNHRRESKSMSSSTALAEKYREKRLSQTRPQVDVFDEEYDNIVLSRNPSSATVIPDTILPSFTPVSSNASITLPLSSSSSNLKDYPIDPKAFVVKNLGTESKADNVTSETINPDQGNRPGNRTRRGSLFNTVDLVSNASSLFPVIPTPAYSVLGSSSTVPSAQHGDTSTSDNSRGMTSHDMLEHSPNSSPNRQRRQSITLESKEVPAAMVTLHEEMKLMEAKSRRFSLDFDV